MAIQVVLVMFRSDGERRSFSLPRTITVVGRREDCDLRIPLAEVSRKHCRIINENDTLRVEDLGSSNGTFVNGERAQEAAINAGDTLAIGPVTFVVQVNGVPADDEIQAAGAVNPNTDTSVSLSPESQGAEGDGLEQLEQLPDENAPQ
ncbi:MAG: FHA domain-containing protein [Tepidisphaeraceae bacterium]|jgi:pSer/pThr/pTyr-binding forkhead associated (FHA) protein